jgi:uncharacterized membrane protein (UPF0127 family)
MPTNEKWRKRQFKQALFAIFMFLLLAGGVVLYANYRELSTLLPITFELESGKETKRLYVEIASTDRERALGLMYRKEGDLARDRGMIFIFPQEKEQSFWMKNTFIPLDMIFVNAKFEVVGIIHDVPALAKESQRVAKPSIYVIEVNGGVAKELGIVEGAKLKVHGLIPKGV